MRLNEMWKLFESTGNIDAYLYYKEIKEIALNSETEINDDKISEEKLLQGF